MDYKNNKAWLYLLPAIIFLGCFMVYPLIDVFVYSFEEGYNSASQTSFGLGGYNYSYVLHDPYFMQAVKNTIPSLAEAMESVRGKMILFLYQFLYQFQDYLEYILTYMSGSKT